jgi:hypothetical protein
MLKPQCKNLPRWLLLATALIVSSGFLSEAQAGPGPLQCINHLKKRKGNAVSDVKCFAQLPDVGLSTVGQPRCRRGQRVMFTKKGWPRDLAGTHNGYAFLTTCSARLITADQKACCRL